MNARTLGAAAATVMANMDGLILDGGRWRKMETYGEEEGKWRGCYLVSTGI